MAQLGQFILANTGSIDPLLYNRPVKRGHFVFDFAGNRFSGRNINQQLMLALQWRNYIVFSLNHTE